MAEQRISSIPQWKKSRVQWLIEIIIALGAILMILPFFIALLATFKPETEIIQFEGVFPRDWTLINYQKIFENSEEIPVIRWLFNSILISSSITILVVFVTSMAAYSLSRLRPPGGRAAFTLIVATIMIPGQLFLVPVYLILNFLHWLDTPLALIVPAASGAFGVFLLSQFFYSIPKDLEDAAEIDGCSIWGVYWHIVLPLMKPALSTLAILTFIGSWNDFLGPLVFLDSTTQLTLPVGIALFQTSYFIEYGITLAASAIATFPAIVIFLIFQKQIIKSISLTGLKG
ncbi:carbohydrate ABC transporter permease [Candidatus Sumerlaeota bacterium]|nr:carbohydrate ABC transporter permease [Candidatus Sumerlaeota bacterium]